jgi:hypothetical protein
VAKNKRKAQKGGHEIFDSIRKPTAPPTLKFGRNKPVEKQMPSLRKTKHKKEDELENEK